jgi:hypothetical protein
VTDRQHRPALFAGHEFSAFEGAADPAVVTQLAHESARELLARVRRADATTREKAVTFADDNGIDVLAELWSKASAHSLPGALWRVYLIRDLIQQQGEHMAHVFEAGVRASSTGDPVIAGAPVPTSAAEVRDLADLILHGVFAGDLADALDRAAAFCRLAAQGGVAQAAEVDVHSAEQAARLTTQAARLSSMGSELAVCARMWRAGTLD